MNNNEFSQNLNNYLEVKNPYIPGVVNPLEPPDIVNDTGNYSNPILDNPLEPTATETQSLIELGTEINTDNLSTASDLLTGSIEPGEPLLNVANDLAGEEVNTIDPNLNEGRGSREEGLMAILKVDLNYF